MLTLLLSLLLPGLLSAQTMAIPPARPLVFTHVTIVDVTGAPSKLDMIVVVAGDRIAAVGKSGKVRLPKNAQVIDASGKFLIPGLWDLHTHAASSGDRTLRFWKLFLAHGITGTREMGNDLKSLELWRREAKRWPALAPRIVWSSPMLDGDPPTYDSGIGILTEQQARARVREMHAAGFDFLKVYNGLPREAFFAIADEARRLGIPIAGEIPDSVTPIEAAEAGMRSFEHLWNLFEFCVPGAYAHRDKLRPLERDKTTVGDKRAVQNLRDRLWLTAYDSRCADRLVAGLRRTGTWQVPTLAINHNYAYMNNEPRLNDPRRKWVPPKFLAHWGELRAGTLAEYGPESAAAWRARYQAEADLVRRFSEAGIGILAGSDATDWEPFIYPGASLHDELGLLVEAGLSPLKALQSATINPAIFLGKEAELGTIEKGKLADMVLLDADPLENIGNTKRINGVLAGGRYFTKEALQKMLVEAEAAAAANEVTPR